MKTKPILCPERLRHVPRQFSWIDQRLVRDRHIQGRSSHALALYLFLCTVADAQGLSYYSDTRLGELLGLSGADLRAARSELRSAGLIAWQSPLYQVLSLERASEAPPATPPPPRTGEVRSAAELLRAIMQEGLQ
jgi:hypothetical protein